MNFQLARFTDHARPTASRVSLVNVNKSQFSKEILNRKVYFLCNVLGKNLQVFFNAATAYKQFISGLVPYIRGHSKMTSPQKMPNFRPPSPLWHR